MALIPHYRHLTTLPWKTNFVLQVTPEEPVEGQRVPITNYLERNEKIEIEASK